MKSAKGGVQYAPYQEASWVAKREGGGGGQGMWGMHGTVQLRGAGRYLLLVVAGGMAVCLAGMLRRFRGLELGGRAEGGGMRNTGLKRRSGL